MCTFINTHIYFCRKSGGSVDNLLDDLGGDVVISSGNPGAISTSVMSQASKKKSVSSKNLSMGGSEQSSGMKIVAASSDTEESVRITTV